jgi:tRNA A22 N-methylase
MTDDLTSRERAIGEQVAAAASPVFAQRWLAEMLKIEERELDPAERWATLKEALRIIGRQS